ncbi:rho GTPase-activating protein 7-like isoform X2 [Camellia sinensis]|uniref:rho GTPase-activating protein 7-like isoform X2 n=1 Tax=Camellia sinensis TaxID=4442 RepID=UPI001035F3ED|nr:rho GTPase-activating protein 7-like isoform X2 [Camellia sinensis]
MSISRAHNEVIKSGPLFTTSKGLGWKYWKKRWVILTRISLVFFKNDPSTLPQRGGEVNLILGGIDLDNSGSVVVREDKRLLTILFPDTCDGRGERAFTLKAETSKDLYDWKTALEHALSQAPSATFVMEYKGIIRNNVNDTIEGSFHQSKIVAPPLPGRDKRPVKSMVVGRPILLALEDIDGGPSFLEKALRYLEKYGTNVEGILRQSADVEEIDRRVQEYELGKNEFAPDEDAHVVGDCVKHVLRELPSPPVPASYCTALLEAYKIDRKEARVNSMRSAILETFPEPNRRLLQRILKMMHTISLHASENRMTPSAIAACMAPLLLRPLVAGECELEDGFNVNIDISAQLLAAANAANNAQAIITALLEEYETIFNDDNLHSCSISADSHSSGSEDSTNDENMDIYHDAENEGDPDTDDDLDRVLSGKLTESSGYIGNDLYDYKAFGGNDLDGGPPGNNLTLTAQTNPPVDSQLLRESNTQFNEQQGQQKPSENEMDSISIVPFNESHRSMGEIMSSMDQGLPQSVVGAESCVEKSMNKLTSSTLNVKRSTFLGRNTARKTPSMESIDSSGEEELAIQRLEITKNDLQHRIAKGARGNAILQASLERRKEALHERRLALEQDVSRLQEQLQAERDLRAALEVGLSMSSGQFSTSRGMDSKTMAELEEIALAEADVARLKQKVAELHHQLNQQCQHQYSSLSDACDNFQHVQNHNSQLKKFQQDFDVTLAFVNHERKQRTEESLLGAELRNIKGQVLTSGRSSRQPAQKQFIDSASFGDSKSIEASTSIYMDELYAVDSTSVPSTSRVAEVLASSTLVELTTRLDFKERRTQLMEQLHNLDLNYGTASSQDFAYIPASPSWK